MLICSEAGLTPTAPLLVAWLGPYLHDHLPGFDGHGMWWHSGGDLVFVASLFVLGGDFWDKVRSLFIHDAEVRFSHVG